MKIITKPKNVKPLGRGAFSTVHVNPENDKEVLIFTNDPIKEMYMLSLCEFFPKAEWIGQDNNHDDVYKMARYERVTAPSRQLNKEALTVYKTLRKIISSTTYSLRGIGQAEQVQMGIKGSNLSNQIKEDLISAICDAMCYSSSLGIELSPRNIATNENGDLILLDMFFCVDTLKRNRAH